MSTVIDVILETKIVAIVRLERYDRAVEITRALLAGGISVVEFTLTGAGAYDAIAATRAALGDSAHIGVGTVLNVDAATASIDAGAQFVVTPTTSPAVIRACVARGTPILSGALTPTEALTAYEAGANMVKLFPARLGGPQYLRDMLAPLPFLRIVPTGGVGAENARAYIDAPYRELSNYSAVSSSSRRTRRSCSAKSGSWSVAVVWTISRSIDQ